MHIFNDILEFIKTLTFIDYVFFFAVIILLILIVTLIYFIRSNNEVFIKETDDKEDLMEISKKMEEEHPRIEFTSYEKDQEEKAIISYDELIAKNKLGKLNYEEETNLDGLSIKKINLDDSMGFKNEEVPLEPKIRVISYQNEEQFLLALKQLQSLLN